MKRRIVHIVQKMAPGGLEVLALNLASRLPGEHSLISLEGEAEELKERWPRLAAGNVRLVGLNKRPGLDLALVARLAWRLRADKIDAAFTHHAGPLVYGGIAARLAGVGALYHVEHDVWHYQDARRLRLMRMIAMLTRPHVIGVAERMREPLKAIFPHLEVEIIANGVSLERAFPDRASARARLGIADHEQVVGAVGRLETVKGHDVLIEAAQRMTPPPLVVLVGDGSRRDDLARLAARLGLGERVRFLGHRDDVEDLLPAFDVFCQPSRNEGLPLAVLEAQAAGVPVVASDVGDVARAVCRTAGRLTPPQDPAALASALSEVLRSPAQGSPRAFVAAHFDLNQTYTRYAHLLGA